MRKILVLGLLGMIGFFSFIPKTTAQVKVTLYLFRGDGCSHCEAAMEYLNSIKNDYPMMEVVDYEVYNNEANATLWNSVKEKLNSDSKGVPFMVIGERYLTGFAEYRKEDIKAALEYYRDNPNDYKDIVMMVNADNGGEHVPTTTGEVSEDVKPVEMHTEKDKMYRNLAISVGLLILAGGAYWWLSKKEKRA